MRLCFALVFGLSCLGARGETLKMKDEAIKSRISLKHLNRIAVKNDRIASVSGLDEAFHFEKNEKTGEGYLKPTAENGFDLLEKLHEAGYSKLYLMSGRNFENQNPPPYVTVLLKNVKNIEKLLST